MTRALGAGTRIAIVAGEASGDHLGAALLDALRRQATDIIAFGVGGPEMVARGFRSHFPMSEIAVMGPLAIVRQLPRLRQRLLETVDVVVEDAPDALVIIDCPEFSHRVATRVRRRMPGLPIIDYVAPSVWAWRPGRARRMRHYVDEVMALLPFEPAVFEELGGPRCHYVGHPAAEHAAPSDAVIETVRKKIAAKGRPILAVMPGSRRSELNRLCAPFAEAVAILAASDSAPVVVVPTLPHLQERIEHETRNWAVRPTIVTTGEERHAAMHLADAAIVASGTATLELALSRTPMVVGYRTDQIAAFLRPFLVRVPSIVLANLIHGGNPIIELFQAECTGERLAAEAAPLLRESEARRAQCAALNIIIRKVMDGGTSPSDRAAAIVLNAVQAARRDNAAPSLT